MLCSDCYIRRCCLNRVTWLDDMSHEVFASSAADCVLLSSRARVKRWSEAGLSCGLGPRPSDLAWQAGIKAKSKMSKAEKLRQKKDKAKNFNTAGAPAAKKAQKNAKRWQ